MKLTRSISMSVVLLGAPTMALAAAPEAERGPDTPVAATQDDARPSAEAAPAAVPGETASAPDGPPSESPEPSKPDPNAPPAERKGVQFALRAGYAHPLGQLTALEGNAMSVATTGHFALQVDVGGRFAKALYLGGYLGFGVGGVGSVGDGICGSAGISCGASAVRGGVQARYHFGPAERWDPWAGFGFGVENLSIHAGRGGATQEERIWGIDFARLSGGVNYRISRFVGAGPVLEGAIGSYLHQTVLLNDAVATSAGVDHVGVHMWLSAGVQLVMLP